ncbi:hypothetical protein ACFO3I_14375 [Rheinheimera marina]|uniref:Uncharacterized protein n=1 Tax=Rheinheimera marina TaxID=1774958 RepID=A0ABV9JPJ9_9GAMM
MIKQTPAVFDRFGWYWQPASWLAEMSPADVTAATKKAIDLSPVSRELLASAALNRADAKATRLAMQLMLNSLHTDTTED